MTTKKKTIQRTKRPKAHSAKGEPKKEATVNKSTVCKGGNQQVNNQTVKVVVQMPKTKEKKPRKKSAPKKEDKMKEATSKLKKVYEEYEKILDDAEKLGVKIPKELTEIKDRNTDDIDSVKEVEELIEIVLKRTAEIKEYIEKHASSGGAKPQSQPQPTPQTFGMFETPITTGFFPVSRNTIIGQRETTPQVIVPNGSNTIPQGDTNTGGNSATVPVQSIISEEIYEEMMEFVKETTSKEKLKELVKRLEDDSEKALTGAERSRLVEVLDLAKDKLKGMNSDGINIPKTFEDAIKNDPSLTAPQKDEAIAKLYMETNNNDGLEKLKRRIDRKIATLSNKMSSSPTGGSPKEKRDFTAYKNISEDIVGYFDSLIQNHNSGTDAQGEDTQGGNTTEDNNSGAPSESGPVVIDEHLSDGGGMSIGDLVPDAPLDQTVEVRTKRDIAKLQGQMLNGTVRNNELNNSAVETNISKLENSLGRYTERDQANEFADVWSDEEMDLMALRTSESNYSPSLSSIQKAEYLIDVWTNGVYGPESQG